MYNGVGRRQKKTSEDDWGLSVGGGYGVSVQNNKIYRIDKVVHLYEHILHQPTWNPDTTVRELKSDLGGFHLTQTKLLVNRKRKQIDTRSQIKKGFLNPLTLNHDGNRWTTGIFVFWHESHDIGLDNGAHLLRQEHLFLHIQLALNGAQVLQEFSIQGYLFDGIQKRDVDFDLFEQLIHLGVRTWFVSTFEGKVRYGRDGRNGSIGLNLLRCLLIITWSVLQDVRICRVGKRSHRRNGRLRKDSFINFLTTPQKW